MAFRTINTKDAHIGPNGVRYVHDAARPWAVLRNSRHGEICVGRYSTEKAAKNRAANDLAYVTNVRDAEVA
jgi:hypothetical protein